MPLSAPVTDRATLAPLLSARSPAAVGAIGLGGKPLRLAQLGDSRLALQLDGFGLSAGSPGHWIGVRSRQRIQCPPWLNGAVGGEKSDQTLARLVSGAATNHGGTGIKTPLLPYFVAQGVTHCLMILPINDHNTVNNYALAAMKNNVQSAIDALNSAGITAVVLTSHPHDSVWTPVWTTQQLDFQANLRAWLMAKAGQPGVIPVDVSDIFADPATGLAIVSTLKDQTHPTVTSCFLMAGRVVDALLPLAGPYNPLPISNRDGFSADNPLGNIWNNPMLVGANTAASFFSTQGGATVNILGVANGCTFSASNCTGLTINVSKADDPFLGPGCQQLDISGTSGAAAPQVDFLLGGGWGVGTIAPGSVLGAIAGLSVDAGTSGVLMSMMMLSTVSAGQFYGDGAAPSGQPTPLPAQAWNGIQSVPFGAFTTAANASGTVARVRTAMQANTTIKYTARFRGLGVYRNAP